MNRRLVAAVAALVLGLASCSSSDEPVESPAWGSEATRYFRALAGAYTASDVYGVLDFYAPTAEVEKWRGAVEGGARVSYLLRSNSGDLAHELEEVYLGGNGALTVVVRPLSGDQEAIVSTLDRGLIAHEIVFDQATTLARSFRASPDVIAPYEDLYADFALAWSDDSRGHRAQLYAADASVNDALNGLGVSGREAIAATGSLGGWSPVGNADPASRRTPADGPGVYLGPRDYAQDPQRAVGAYTVTDGEGCDRRVAVLWIMEAGLIAEEHRYWEVESSRRCASGLPPDGWWTGLALPEPSDQVVTGVVRSASGREIAIRNGTPRLEEFLRYGMERFAVADLDEPVLDSVIFEPSRSCVDRSGRVVVNDGSRDLFLCMYESDLCPGRAACSMPTLNARLAVLHELAHAWMLDQVGEEDEQRLLEVAGLETWASLSVPWPERGAEYSADVLAWGLLDQAIPMVRLGSPPCDELTAAFEVLTGSTPLRDESGCSGSGAG